MNKTINIILAGVGGQGVLTASEVLARAALHEGLECKKSEVHGMAQRGGSVISHVRIGEIVYSPVIPEGGADFLVAFEKLEGLRFAHCLRPGGIVIINQLELYPMKATAASGYPSDIEERLAALDLRVVMTPGQDLAGGAGDIRSAGSALLGALSGFLPFTYGSWAGAISESFKSDAARTNVLAFELGRDFVSGKKPQLYK
jgi:indolepyruvate ferredoxin oxidoreductase beta subunit